LYTDANLETHLNQSATIEAESLIYAEINLNDPSITDVIGNYRNRPANAETIASTFVAETSATPEASRKYYGYTDSDVVVDGSYETNDVPAAFSSIEQKRKLLFSLEDCFGKFRPRSGINKAMAFGEQGLSHYLHTSSSNMMNRPRYYMADKDDKFKYWNSYRNQKVVVAGEAFVQEHGISRQLHTYDGETADTFSYYISDAAPFIVYNQNIPVNRVVIKLQTNVGTSDNGSIFNGISEMTDPLYDKEGIILNRSVPIRWRVEYLSIGSSPTWTTLYDFATSNPTGYRAGANPKPVVPRDGYVELVYNPNTTGWAIAGSAEIDSSTTFFTEFTNPSSNQFKYIKGLRVVVDTMSKKDATFDLIELSPRLAMNVSNIVTEYSVNKVASDLGVSGLPVAQILPSNGSITIADYDQALNTNNPNSVIADYINRYVQLKFYEVIKNVPIAGSSPQSKYIPVKTMYMDGFPEIDNKSRMASVRLRDLYFYFESMTAPEILIPNCSFSYAIAMLLDSIGFTNYVYYKSDSDEEQTIPFFFVGPNTTVAQVIENLAISTQTSAFFDEYNNLVFMSRSYMLAEPGDRESDTATVIRGDKSGNNLPNIIEISNKKEDVFNDGRITYVSRYIQKSYGEVKQANLIDEGLSWKYKPSQLWEISPEDQPKSTNEEKRTLGQYLLAAIPLNSDLSNDVPLVSNGVIINNVMDLGEAVFWLSRYNGYFYANSEIIKYDAVEYSIAQPSQTEALTATLTAGQNTVTLTSGDTSQLQVGQRLSKISGAGMFGESVKVASIVNQTSFTTNVNHLTSSGSGNSIQFVGRNSLTNYWISSLEEYQKYFAQIPFNGKMYPTGRVRIFAEPNYTNDTTLANGPVAKHGRGQFDTRIVSHTSDLPSWVKNNTGGIITSGNALSNNYQQDFIVNVGGDSTIASGSIKIPIEDADMKYIRKGQKVTGASGKFANNTKVAKKTKNGIKLTKATTGSLASTAIISVGGVKIYDYELEGFSNGAVGVDPNKLYNTATRTSLIKNYMGTGYQAENQSSTITTTQSAKVKSSAFVFTGPTFPPSLPIKPKDYISYSYQTFGSESNSQTPGKYNHFGTRIRVVGAPENSKDTIQSPYGAMDFYTGISSTSNAATVIKGGSGGLGVLVDPLTNNGYFFEIAALTVENFDQYSNADDMYNLMFYKIVQPTGGNGSSSATESQLWRGRTSVTADDGDFVGQHRMTTQQNPTVYDLSVEYKEINDEDGSKLKFYLYVNNKLIGSVIDDSPIINRKQNVALFVRGTSKCMFENVYAIKANESSNYVDPYETPMSSNMLFTKEEVADDAFRNYKLPDAICDSYLQGISPITTRSSDLYFEEFGTIMREASYINIKYDKAYPALLASITPTFNRLKGYAVSGFIAGAYGAEFLLFNVTDTVLSLDETTGNHLQIQGVTFTQSSAHDLTVDDYYQQKSNMSDPSYFGTSVTNQPLTNKKNYQSIKNSRLTYGRKEFNINAPYIQSQDAADSLMGWISKKILKPRRSIGMTIFANPTIQLGDIVTIDYQSETFADVALSTTRFVVYNIEYARSGAGPKMTIYLSEVA
jgi:hypothetical protein